MSRPTLRAAVAAAALLCGLCGCSAYDPPVQADHTADQYKADLEKCRTTSTETVRIKNADTPWTWMKSPFTGPPEVRAAIRTCMQDKKYVLQKDAD
jgi:hypothetical protein